MNKKQAHMQYCYDNNAEHNLIADNVAYASRADEKQKYVYHRSYPSCYLTVGRSSVFRKRCIF